MNHANSSMLAHSHSCVNIFGWSISKLADGHWLSRLQDKTETGVCMWSGACVHVRTFSAAATAPEMTLLQHVPEHVLTVPSSLGFLLLTILLLSANALTPNGDNPHLPICPSACPHLSPAPADHFMTHNTALGGLLVVKGVLERQMPLHCNVAWISLRAPEKWATLYHSFKWVFTFAFLCGSALFARLKPYT